MDEQIITEKCQQGDLEEFGQLYDKYIKKIYDFVYYRVQHKETTEDLVSQIFTKALENVKKYNPAKGSFSSWLYRIARNTVIDHYRTKKDSVNIEDIWDMNSNEDIERDVDAKQKLQDVQRYLSRLKKEQREIIIMRVWDELSYREIAEITGKSEAGCKMLFARTIARLRQEMPLGIIFLLLIYKL